ncbi:MAG: glycosyltransferase family 4 protein [Anaerolineae bacterium]|nr:glycosyltransferase family 4 protein [Anaerolineae bacterium]
MTLKPWCILIVGNFLSGAMMNRAMCEDIAERLATAGWPVITTSTYAGRLHRLLDMIQTAWRHRKIYDIAIMDVFSGPAFFWSYLVSRVFLLTQKPFILVLRGGNLPVFAQRWPKKVSQLLHTARLVTTPSRFLLEQMRFYRDDLVLLPNPIDLSQYKFQLRNKPQPRLIWLRAFHQIYNPSLAPHVLSQLTGAFPDIQLIMVGPDKGDGSFQETQRVAVALGVAERIQYPGQVTKSDVPLWLNKGDIFLNTTNIDNTPISVMEAMACGLCVVSTNVGGLPYLLTHEQDALLVPQADALAMSEAIKRLLNDSNLSEKLSLAGHQTVSQMDWAIILPQWESLLVEAINK